MSWASEKRSQYIGGVVIIALIILSVPVISWLKKPATCNNGKQDGGETAIDKGGPCQVLDERTLTPEAVMWVRAFQTRSGLSSVVAYIDNPNANAGVVSAPYRFALYDENNVLIAEREGETFITPGSVTPIFESQIDTGNRVVARAFFEFTGPFVWRKAKDVSRVIQVTGKQALDTASAPRIIATITNTGVSSFKNVKVVAVIFDTAGNAFAASQTLIPEIGGRQKADVVFTWPSPLSRVIGHIDVTPTVAPVAQ